MTLPAIAQAQFGAERPDGLEPGQAGVAHCATNISPAEQRKRLASGVIGAGLGLAILVVLLAAGADRLCGWRCCRCGGARPPVTFSGATKPE